MPLKLKDDYLHHFDENINSLFKFYYYSPIRRKELKDMASEIEVEFKQFGLLQNIRWLASCFGDFEASPLKNLCALFDFKLWPKSFNDDKKWGFDILDEVTTFYKNHKFISEEEIRRCIRQWPLFHSRVSKFKVEKVYDVYVDILDENEYIDTV